MDTPNKIKAALDAAIFEAMTGGEFVGDYRDFTRNRKIPVETTIKLLLSMHGGSLKKELYDYGINATPSAFVQQRTKISPDLFLEILHNFNHKHQDATTYRGYRLLAVDGTCINMARNPNADSFVCNASNPKGYNQLHLNPLYDILNQTYFDCIIQPQPRTDEIGALIAMLYMNDFDGKNLIIADRGYESYNTFAHLLNRDGVDFLIRVKQDRSAMREIAKLPAMVEFDMDISFTITTTQTNADKKNGYIFLQVPKNTHKENSPKTRVGRWDFPSPYPMSFRVVRFMLDTGEYETVCTSLPNSFTIDDIKELYHMRWGIETSFRMLKYAVGLINLHGKCDDFVRQEIYAALTMYNFCNRISNMVVVQQKKSNAYAYKVNLTMAIYLCKQFYRTPNADGEKLIKDIARYTEPVRPGRRDERNIRAKSFAGFTYRVAA